MLVLFCENSTDLFDVPPRATVVLTNHPFDPLAKVESVNGHHAMEVFGQRLGALQRNLFLCEDAP